MSGNPRGLAINLSGPWPLVIGCSVLLVLLTLSIFLNIVLYAALKDVASAAEQTVTEGA